MDAHGEREASGLRQSLTQDSGFPDDAKLEKEAQRQAEKALKKWRGGRPAAGLPRASAPRSPKPSESQQAAAAARGVGSGCSTRMSTSSPELRSAEAAHTKVAGEQASQGAPCRSPGRPAALSAQQHAALAGTSMSPSPAHHLDSRHSAGAATSASGRMATSMPGEPRALGEGPAGDAPLDNASCAVQPLQLAPSPAAMGGSSTGPTGAKQRDSDEIGHYHPSAFRRGHGRAAAQPPRQPRALSLASTASASSGSSREEEGNAVLVNADRSISALEAAMAAQDIGGGPPDDPSASQEVAADMAVLSVDERRKPAGPPRVERRASERIRARMGK